MSLKALLDEFSGLNIDTGVAVVEAAGAFLLRTPDTSTRMANMLEVRVTLSSWSVRQLAARVYGC
jgi:regulator of nonsense transcripts 2